MKTKRKTKTQKKPSSKKQQQKKIIIASVAVGAAGILGYFGWQYLKKKKEARQGNNLEEILKTTSSISEDIPAYTAPKSNNTAKTSSSPAYSIPSSVSSSVFPLKKGSKGEPVRLLQQALIAKYGKTILPKYGADGDFGSETANALKKAGLPASINESTFNVLVQATKIDSNTLGNELYKAAIAKDYNKVLSLLKQMQSVDDYSSANEVFKQNRINSVRQTIVNGLLNSFTSTTQKEAIKFEFLRMGLQFDGSKWSLSGFDGKPIVTNEATTVWINAAEGVKVPARMVLGNEISRRLDYTLFENNGKYFLVYTKSVQYLN
ncbi:MAG: peptidoglycan-binding domain-containing protein [Bacteroidota bacterium]